MLIIPLDQRGLIQSTHLKVSGVCCLLSDSAQGQHSTSKVEQKSIILVPTIKSTSFQLHHPGDFIATDMTTTGGLPVWLGIECVDCLLVGEAVVLTAAISQMLTERSSLTKKLHSLCAFSYGALPGRFSKVLLASLLVAENGSLRGRTLLTMAWRTSRSALVSMKRAQQAEFTALGLILAVQQTRYVAHITRTPLAQCKLSTCRYQMRTKPPDHHNPRSARVTLCPFEEPPNVLAKHLPTSRGQHEPSRP